MNPGKGWRGWPEGYGYLTSKPQIQRMQISDVVAEGLEHVLDHQAGTIGEIGFEQVSVPKGTKRMQRTGEAKILNDVSTIKQK